MPCHSRIYLEIPAGRWYLTNCRDCLSSKDSGRSTVERPGLFACREGLTNNMPQLDQRPPKDQRQRNNPGNGGDPNFNWRGVILLAVALLLVLGAVYFKGPYSAPEEKTPAELIKLVQAGDLSVKDTQPLEVVMDDQKGMQYLD